MLKLALNKSMHTSDDEQGINKLWPWVHHLWILNYWVWTIFILVLIYLTFVSCARTKIDFVDFVTPWRTGLVLMVYLIENCNTFLCFLYILGNWLYLYKFWFWHHFWRRKYQYCLLLSHCDGQKVSTELWCLIWVLLIL